MLIDQAGMEWLQENHREISRVGERILIGTFRFKAYLSEKTNCSIESIYGTSVDEWIRKKPGFLEDRFLIRLVFHNDRPPCVWETGGRLLARANFLGKSLNDLHIGPDGKVCLGLPEIVALKAHRYPGVQNFFVHQIAPYFYYHAYREKHDDKEPWPGLSHDLGLATLEQIGFDKDDSASLGILLPLAAKKLPQNIIIAKTDRVQCLCKMGKKMVDCHPEAAIGHRIFRDRAPSNIVNARPSLRLYLERKRKNKTKRARKGH